MKDIRQFSYALTASSEKAGSVKPMADSLAEEVLTVLHKVLMDSVPSFRDMNCITSAELRHYARCQLTGPIVLIITSQDPAMFLQAACSHEYVV